MRRRFQSEKAFEKWARTELKKLPKSFVLPAYTGSVRGILDINCCLNGHFVALELKLDGVPRDPGREKLQEYTAKQIKASGAKVVRERVTPGNWNALYDLLIVLSKD